MISPRAAAIREAIMRQRPDLLRKWVSPPRQRRNGQLPPTRRHLEVLEVLSHGATREEAAIELGCGVETIKEHLKRVKPRLDAKTSTHAVATALRRGLIK